MISEPKLKNAIQWLIENAGPVIRYRTLTEIIKVSPGDARVDELYREIQNSNRLKQITSCQNEDGSFGQKSFHHGTESTETYLRELLEMGLCSNVEVVNKGILYAEKLYNTDKKDIGWIPGIYLEPIGRVAPSTLVEEWASDYYKNFMIFLKNHRTDWLISKNGKLATCYLEIPYIYVIRALSNSWWWLRDRNCIDLLPILEFLLVDMASIHNLYWIAPNKQLFSYPNFLHILSPGVISNGKCTQLDFAIALEGLWLLSKFGIIERFSGLKNAFEFISSNINDEGVWDFPIKGMTKAKAGWNSYHGFSLEDNWRRKEAGIAELTFRICLTAMGNKEGMTVQSV